jgi:hypothetical protein
MQLATQSAWATYVQPYGRRWFVLLREIDQTFVKGIQALNGRTPNYFEGLMLVNAHAAFRGAAEFALQARVCETMVLLRSCVEYAMYGIRFHRHPDLIQVWAHRGDGDQEKTAVRNSFRTSDLLADAMALSNAVGDRLRRLYELTIDMGAHPNEVGFFGRLEIDDVPVGKQFKVKYLHGGEPAPACAEDQRANRPLYARMLPADLPAPL